jgi:ArsR family transcriptional regulator
VASARARSLEATTGPACCPTGLATPLDRESAESLARLLKAVADPARLQLLSLIKASPEEESCVCDLTVPLALSQPTVSHHLRVLTDAGLLNRTRRGTWAWYSINSERLRELSSLLA